MKFNLDYKFPELITLKNILKMQYAICFEYFLLTLPYRVVRKFIGIVYCSMGGDSNKYSIEKFINLIN